MPRNWPRPPTGNRPEPRQPTRPGNGWRRDTPRHILEGVAAHWSCYFSRSILTMQKKPNVLLIFTDQHQQRIAGAYGDAVVRTPRMDQLAAEGVVFRNAVVAQPVCTASRASLLTGTYGHTHGCVRNNQVLTTEIPTAAELLGGHGYQCGYLGKWHCGNELQPQRGFENWYCPTEDNYAGAAARAEGLYSPYDRFLRDLGFAPEPVGPHPFFTQRQAATIPEEYCKPAYMAQKADDFFRDAGDQPFFLAMSFLEPHPPYFGPFDGIYAEEEVGLPANHEVTDEESAGWSRRHQAFRRFYYEKGHNIKTSDVDDVLANRARYYGLVTLVDRYIGKTLDALSDRGLADDTIVIVTSDHGDMLGSHQMVDKGMMFEEAIKVPFILRHPGENYVRDEVRQVINNVDVLPTILDLLDLPIPDHVQGRSLLPVLRGEEGEFPDFGVVEWNGFLQNMHARDPRFADVLDAQVRCVVTPDWKLALSPGDRGELYDLRNDPFERRNLFAMRETRGITQELYGMLLKWQEETGDRLRIPDPFAEA